VGYISPIWGADPFGPISTKIGIGIEDVFIQSHFGFNILGVLILQGVKISIFPLPLLVIVTTVLPLRPGADPENCFGRSTLDLSRRRQQSETPKGRKFTPYPVDWGSVVFVSAPPAEPRPLIVDIAHNFVRFHACFNAFAFWNITIKANKTNPIQPPL